MDSTKEGSSETSSDSKDRSDKVNDDKNICRSYECTFCKCGFTNAQALGGHMNMHRKHKAKVQQSTNQSSGEKKQYYSALERSTDYQMYFPTESSPSGLTPNLGFSCVQEDANLSLQIGLPLVEDTEEKRTEGKTNSDGREVDLDLELRLGHNP